MAAPFTFPPAVHKNSSVSASSPTLFIFWFFGNSRPNECEVISLCGFDVYFPDAE